MRITGGKIKGRRLSSFKGTGIRPTSQKIREAIFNIIGNELSGLSVLDLFAGTGIMGIEALSRGASFALFIDYSPKSMRLIRENLRICGLSDRAMIIRKDLRRGLPKIPLEREGFNLIFIDPPYEKGLISPLLERLAMKRPFKIPCDIVIEGKKTESISPLIPNFSISAVRIYGDTKISILSYGEG